MRAFRDAQSVNVFVLFMLRHAVMLISTAD